MTLTFLFALSAVLNDKLTFYQNTRCRHVVEIWFDLDNMEVGRGGEHFVVTSYNVDFYFIIIFYLQNPHFQKNYPSHWGLCPDLKKLLSSQLQIINQKHCIVGPFKLFNRSIAGGSTIGNRRQCRGSTRHVCAFSTFAVLIFGLLLLTVNTDYGSIIILRLDYYTLGVQMLLPILIGVLHGDLKVESQMCQLIHMLIHNCNIFLCSLDVGNIDDHCRCPII